MAFRRGIYMVPTHRWYIGRTVWLIAGVVLLTSTALEALVDPRYILCRGLAPVAQLQEILEQRLDREPLLNTETL